MTMKSCVLLISGGLDSVTLLYWLTKEQRYEEVIGVTYRYGQRHEREVWCATQHMKILNQKTHYIVDISFLSSIWSKGTSLVVGGQDVPDLVEIPSDERTQPITYVPNRNMIFLSIGAGIAESLGVEEVYYSAQAQDEYGYWDCTVEFLQRMNKVLQLNRKRKVTIQAPFITYRKSEIIRLGLRLGVDYGMTWSCYRGEGQACGRCPTCVERRKAFTEAGIEDPLVYQ